MNPTDRALFEKFLNCNCTDDEINQLLDYFGDDTNAENLRDLIDFELNSEGNGLLHQISKERIFKKIDHYVFSNITHTRKTISLRSYLQYAAIITCIALIGAGYFYFNPQDKVKPQLTIKNNIEPGGHKAILKMASGEKIALGETKSFNALPQGVVADQNGIIVYADNSSTNFELNELSIPNGGKYQVVLSDGTKVTLNSMSSLKYPSNFPAHERVVELSGEAFFEVAHAIKGNEKVPFIVKTPKQSIQVLGTKFNVSSYSDDFNQTTTLVSGKVSVSSNINSEKIILLPGQQFITNKNSSFIREANTESATAWVSGNFLFEDMQLSDILKQLSRWYGINVDYTNVPQTRYNVFLSKSEKLPVVLKYLEETGKIKFTLKENTIYIK